MVPRSLTALSPSLQTSKPEGMMLQKLDATQQDLLKQTRESHSVLQKVSGSQEGLGWFGLGMVGGGQELCVK